MTRLQHADYDKKRPLRGSFLDLPAEIRLDIYERVIIAEKPFEFWPEVGCGKGGVLGDWGGRRLQDLYRYPPRKFNLQLLRICWQIYFEIAQVFYSRNEFRFSGVNGHMLAYAWMTKIGRRNWGHIRSLTIGMPCRFPALQTYPDSGCQKHRLYDWMPFDIPREEKRYYFRRHDYQTSWKLFVKKLADFQQIESLKLVLPDFEASCWRPRDDENFHALEKMMVGFRKLIAAKPFLELNIIRMIADYRCPEEIQCWHSCLIRSLRSLAVCRMDFAYSHNVGFWQLEPRTGRWNKHGCLTLDDDYIGEEFLDVLPDVHRVFEKIWG